ncbi:MAG: hypothetical protein RQ715_03580 [Methylococcales bacterium]|nr:hypothetical protein [Methylococcales bacterium]
MLRLLVTAAFGFVLSACSNLDFDHFGEQHMDRDTFAAYVEVVFKLQNRMSSEVMLMEPEGDADWYALLTAEEQMRIECAPLNDYANQLISGQNANLWLRRKVERSADACERAARNVQDLLKQRDQR